MDNQPIKDDKKCSRATQIVTLINVIVALAMVISCFLPIMLIDGETYGFLSYINEPDFFEEIGPVYLLGIVSPNIIAIVWAAIPKKWAAVVGIIYAIPLILWSSLILYVILQQVSVFLTGNFAFRTYSSVLLLVLSTIKLILINIDKKKAQKEN